MRPAFLALLLPALLFLTPATASAGDGALPYAPVTRPPVVSSEPAPPIQAVDPASFGFRLVAKPAAASAASAPAFVSADPAAADRAEAIAAGQDPLSFSSPWHNSGRQAR